MSNKVISEEFSIDNILDINLDLLKQHKFIALILDYDGVLCAQGGIIPEPDVLEWLKKAIAIFGDRKIFILSNNPLPERKEFFSKYFNNQIIFIINKPKPYPDGIAEIYDYCKFSLGTSLEKSTILMVDDRLSTGILAAKIFGVAACLILKPYVNLKKQFIIEFWLNLLRKLERLMLWHL